MLSSIAATGPGWSLLISVTKESRTKAVSLRLFACKQRPVFPERSYESPAVFAVPVAECYKPGMVPVAIFLLPVGLRGFPDNHIQRNNDRIYIHEGRCFRRINSRYCGTPACIGVWPSVGFGSGCGSLRRYYSGLIIGCAWWHPNPDQWSYRPNDGGSYCCHCRVHPDWR